MRWKGNTSHGPYKWSHSFQTTVDSEIRLGFLSTDRRGWMRRILSVSCVGGCEASPPVCHMSLASAKPLHANPQYGHKMEGRGRESMGNSAVFGLTEGFFLNIVSYGDTTGIRFKMMSESSSKRGRFTSILRR